MIITTLLNSDLFQCHYNCALFHSAIIVRLSWQVLEIRYPKTWWCPDLFKCRNSILIGFIRIAYRMISVASPSDDFSTSMVCCLVCTWTWSEPSLASLFKTSPYFCHLLCASSFFSACHDLEIFLSRRPHCAWNNILAFLFLPVCPARAALAPQHNSAQKWCNWWEKSVCVKWLQSILE